MSKTFITALGTAALLLSIGQVASAKDRHQPRQPVQQQSSIFTDANARAANAQYRVYPQTVDNSRYYGGYSALAGH